MQWQAIAGTVGTAALREDQLHHLLVAARVLLVAEAQLLLHALVGFYQILGKEKKKEERFQLEI